MRGFRLPGAGASFRGALRILNFRVKEGRFAGGMMGIIPLLKVSAPGFAFSEVPCARTSGLDAGWMAL